MNIQKYETNYKKNLFLKQISNFKISDYSEKLENNVIQIYPDIKYQKVLGFGGAFTSSTGYSIKKIKQELQNKIYNDYFSEDGIGYNFCRLCIGSSDFSNKSYSYSKQENLQDFSIEKDFEYVIDIIKEAKKLQPNLRFLASPWSPPAFMKDNNSLYLGGKLKADYYKTWAEYLTKYIQKYKENDIKIDYITIQNEPNARQLWESCKYTKEEEKTFAEEFLAPCFQKNKIETKILTWDHNKEKLFDRAKYSFENSNLIAGIAYHYYTGDHFENVNLVREHYPNKLLIHTEGCTGYSSFNKRKNLVNAEIYAHDICGDLNSGANAYIDWNMVLNHRGGPNHKFNFCDSPIMLNFWENNYIKKLSFFYIGHFSKFIKQNARRIAFSKYTDEIEVTAFENEDKSIVAVIFNRTDNKKKINIVLNDTVINDCIEAHSIITYKIQSCDNN